MGKIELYTRPSCKLCNDAKKYLLERNIEFTEYTVDVHITRDDLLSKFTGATILPIVVVNDIWIGGRDELLRYIARYELIERNIGYDGFRG